MGYDLLLIPILEAVCAVVYYSVLYYRRENAGEIVKPKKRGYVIFGGVLLVVCQITILYSLNAAYRKTGWGYGQIFTGNWQIVTDLYFITVGALMVVALFHKIKKYYNPLLLGAISLLMPYLVYRLYDLIFNGVWHF